MTEPTASPDVTGLLGCPFCGGTSVYLRDDDPHHTWVECDDCQIGTLGHDCVEFTGDDVAAAKAAMAAWNRRAPDLALRQEVERVTRDLHSMTDLEELQAKSLDETDAELQAAKASLRLATQRREDVVEALRPFAAFGTAVYGPLYGDNESVFGPVGTEEYTLKVRDFRRASLALQPKEN